MTKQGTKHDEGKVRMGLIPKPALIEIGKVLTFGAKKYAPWNWMQGFDWSRLIDAQERHWNAFVSGTDHDEETGLYHLAHAGCCLLFLLTFQVLGVGKDDRYKFEAVGEPDENKGPPALEEGQVWRCRGGRLVTLERIEGLSHYGNFRCTEGYYIYGNYVNYEGTGYSASRDPEDRWDDDLMELVEDNRYKFEVPTKDEYNSNPTDGPYFKLKEGQKWRRRDGRIVRLRPKNSWFEALGKSYPSGGHSHGVCYYSPYEIESSYDLVELVEDVDG